MPWMFPLGLESGVFMSACASTQTTPIALADARWWMACAAIEPIAIEWSPPSTRGIEPAASAASVFSRTSTQHETTSWRYFMCDSPIGQTSGSRAKTAPSSCTS